MSSKTAPFEGTTHRPAAQQRTSLPEAEDAPIPTYAEASGYAPPPGPPPAATPAATPAAPPHVDVASPPAADELPGYDTIDPKNTEFLLYGTFIHTPNGPAYQLSSPLDSFNSPLRLRRLRAAEIPLAHEIPIAYDRAQTLYEMADPPFRDNEIYMVGKKPHCYGGALQISFGWKTWHIRHIAGPNSAPNEILTCRKVTVGGGLFGKGKNKAGAVEKDGLTEPFEWRDAKGRVMAVEGLQLLSGGVVPTVRLSEGLDGMWRELMVAFWAARLWATFR